jgi:8-oxo-dGTP pyrophosphatase MutT (NUDIX family)
MENNKSIVNLIKPKDFIHDMEACACYLKVNDELLYLKKAKNRWAENRWTVPCGRKEKGEDLITCMIRELFEETQIKANKRDLKFLKTLYVYHEHANFLFHMFEYLPTEKLNVEISDEHSDYLWVNINAPKNVELVPGGRDALNIYKDISSNN